VDHATTTSGTHDGGTTSISSATSDHSTTTMPTNDGDTTTHEGDDPAGE